MRKLCRTCRQPLDVIAQAARSAECSRCSWEAGIMYDGCDEPEGMIVTSLEHPDGEAKAAD